MDVSTISTVIELPENLHRMMQAYLAQHPTMDADGVASIAIGLFLTKRLKPELAIGQSLEQRLSA